MLLLITYTLHHLEVKLYDSMYMYIRRILYSTLPSWDLNSFLSFRFQPTILCFFLVEIPCIWLLELDKVSEIQMRHNQSSTVLDGFYLRVNFLNFHLHTHLSNTRVQRDVCHLTHTSQQHTDAAGFASSVQY